MQTLFSGPGVCTPRQISGRLKARNGLRGRGVMSWFPGS